MFGRKAKKIIPIEPDVTEEPGEEESESVGISLEDLGNAYANAVHRIEGKATTSDSLSSELPSAVSNPLAVSEEDWDGDALDAPDVGGLDHVPVSTESVLEAILFLGTSDSKSIDAERLVSLFRNMHVDELDEAIGRLNAKYRSQSRAFEIVAERGGFRMRLARDMEFVRDRFYGKVKEMQLPQGAIDCLALIAYNPGMTRDEVEHLWNQPPNSTLNMLVRKGLLKVEKEEGKLRYYTTERFLDIVGLDSVDDLPREEL